MCPLNDIQVLYNEKLRSLVEFNESTANTGADITEAHADIQKSSSEYSDDDIWIFGYGSLMWKIDFPCIDWRRGYICGYLRRFYQHSVDHRGTSWKPGRVVTLIPATPADRVYGVAYRVAAKDRESVLRHLDFREKNGYERCSVTFHVFDEQGENEKSNFDIVIYIATAENESWAGDGDNNKIENIAEQIFTSAGPSGRNREYLFNLVKSMNYLFPGVQDDHLLELEAAVRKRIQTDEVPTLEAALKKELQGVVKCEQETKMSEVEWKQVQQSKIEHLVKFCSKVGWREYFLAKELYNIHILSLWNDDDDRRKS